MAQPKSTSRYILTALATILVVTAFVLVGLNAFQLEQKLGSAVKENYVKGYLAARERYATMCPIASQETNRLFGQVRSVGASSLTIVQQSLDADPIVDGVSATRVVNVTSATIIDRVIQKSPEQIRTELATFAKLKNPTTPPPAQVTYQKISLGDIAEGARVFVQSSSDIRLSGQFDATLVRVMD